MLYSPIIVFGFNRPKLLKQTLKRLSECRQAIMSDLFIYVDGPRNDKDSAKVTESRDVAKAVNGFKSVTCRFSEQNTGLAQSIIGGVTEVIQQYGRVIVIEDDLVVSPGFLEFMNAMLARYKSDDRIFQVSGFGVKINKPKDYQYDYYMHIRAHSWTWGTWLDRWETVDWEVSDFADLCSNQKKQRAFNKGGSDLFAMLKDYMSHKNNSWYIRFTYSMFCQNRYAVMPVRSLVRNCGFGEDATHCNTYNRYKIDFNIYGYGNWDEEAHLVYDKRLGREASKYWSIRYRLYGKLMTRYYQISRRLLNISPLSKIWALKQCCLTSRSDLGTSGKNSEIGFPVYIANPKNVHMEDNTAIRLGAYFINNNWENIIIKKYSVLGPKCTIVTNNHTKTVGIPQILLGAAHVNDTSSDVIIHEDVWVGANVTLLSGAELGRGSIVGACSLVNKFVPPYAVVVGSPARIIGSTLTVNQILEHERSLYPVNERYSRDYLETLFDTYYKDKKVYGVQTCFSEEDMANIEWAKRKRHYDELSQKN